MPCSECPHCKQKAAQSRFRLPPRPSNAGPRSSNLPFYAAFGQAYTLARQTSAQPMVVLRAANPGLTPSQCTTYLKRARQLGYLAGVGKPAHLAAAPDPEPTAPAAASTGRRRGRTSRGKAGPSTAAATIARLEARWTELDEVLARWKANRTRVTPAVLIRDSPVPVPDGDAAAVQEWLVAEGLAEWDQWHESVLMS